jgi:hypothetical protein
MPARGVRRIAVCSSVASRDREEEVAPATSGAAAKPWRGRHPAPATRSGRKGHPQLGDSATFPEGGKIRTGGRNARPSPRRRRATEAWRRAWTPPASAPAARLLGRRQRRENPTRECATRTVSDDAGSSAPRLLRLPRRRPAARAAFRNRRPLPMQRRAANLPRRVCRWEDRDRRRAKRAEARVRIARAIGADWIALIRPAAYRGQHGGRRARLAAFRAAHRSRKVAAAGFARLASGGEVAAIRELPRSASGEGRHDGPMQWPVRFAAATS